MESFFINSYSRRMMTIAVFTVGCIVASLLFPVAIVSAFVGDLVFSRTLSVTRALLQAYVFLAVEAIGLFRIVILTVVRPGMSEECWVAAHERLIGWWARAHLDWTRRIFRIQIVVEGEDALGGRPFILVVRHASVIDNVFPAVFAIERHRVSMTWVLNWTLMRDPCIDIVGHRIGCVFVRGRTRQSLREINVMREASASLGSRRGLVIYPEGTLYSRAKYARALRKAERSRDPELLEFTRSLRNTLPPQIGGTIAIIEQRPDLDVVFCSHSGLEGSLDKASIIAGGLHRKVIRIAFWRVAASDIPRDRTQLRRWLFCEWRKVDDLADAQTMLVTT
ncbi:MAG: 1-acyl-sn-glycerol-3-phosphate acyltransferase [Pseudomonadales bacterium]|nr:1-acyl-sn-glycerol-3-phosphate acyltransferase [Pseudomonadales bacterium]